MGVVVKRSSSWMSCQGSFHWATTPWRECQHCNRTIGASADVVLAGQLQSLKFPNRDSVHWKGSRKGSSGAFLKKTKVLLLKGFNTCFIYFTWASETLVLIYAALQYGWVADLADREVVLKHTRRRQKDKTTLMLMIFLHLYFSAVISHRYTFINSSWQPSCYVA